MKLCKIILIILILVVIVHGTANAERYGVYIVDAHGGLNVRMGPDIEYKIKYGLCDGAEVVVTDICNGWGLVNFRSCIGNREPMGWVCMDYLVKRYEIDVRLE